MNIQSIHIRDFVQINDIKEEDLTVILFTWYLDITLTDILSVDKDIEDIISIVSSIKNIYKEEYDKIINE